MEKLTVSKLINELMEYDPEREIYVHIPHGTNVKAKFGQSFRINEIVPAIDQDTNKIYPRLEIEIEEENGND